MIEVSSKGSMQRFRKSASRLAVFLLAASVFLRVVCASTQVGGLTSSASTGGKTHHSRCHDPEPKEPSSPPSSPSSQQECCAGDAARNAAPSARYVAPVPFLVRDDVERHRFFVGPFQPVSGNSEEILSAPPGHRVLRI